MSRNSSEVLLCHSYIAKYEGQTYLSVTGERQTAVVAHEIDSMSDKLFCQSPVSDNGACRS